MFPIIYSSDFLNHDTGKYHPECADRLKAIVDCLENVSWRDQLQWLLPTPIKNRDVLTWVQKVHTLKYIKRVEEIANNGGGRLDADTPISPQSYQIALLAVSAWLDGVDQVLTNHKPAFVLARPPGHHATKNTGMGFCLFSNAAIASYYALAQTGVKKIAILDWDVHHGNGTQEIVETNQNIIYCSLHQSPCYPGTGNQYEQGLYQNVLNIPIKAGSTIQEYQPLFQQKVIPFLKQFEPDILIISAGYDANNNDPLASVSLQPEDFGLFTKYCLEITPKILFGLEGGYDFDTLAESVKSTIENCLSLKK